MPTRRQRSETREFNQSAFASSSEYERGILGNLVAARCDKVSDREDIATLWWLQQISWREGGLEKFAAEFIAANHQIMGTSRIREYGVKPGQVYSAEQVRAIREEMSDSEADQFPLKSDYRPWRSPLSYPGAAESAPYTDRERENFPDEYPAEEVRAACLPQAGRIADALRKLLVDPKSSPSTVYVNHCPDYWSALKMTRQAEIEAAKRSGLVETEITKQVFDELDYARESRSFVLIEGREGIGKSEGARAWCDQHPGQAVYVRLESGSDETTLYRSIAKRIGTACSNQRTAVDMRSRIQDALQAGYLMLVLDEAHFLWPQANRSERSVPKRLDWLRTALIDFGVPVALISTPQFFHTQCARFRAKGWNANQIERRLARTAVLPDTLSQEDVLAVTKKYFPAVLPALAKKIAGVSLLTIPYLTAIVHLRKRVDFFATRNPAVPEVQLIARALDEVIESNGMDLAATKTGEHPSQTELVLPTADALPVSRSGSAIPAEPSRRATNCAGAQPPAPSRRAMSPQLV